MTRWLLLLALVACERPRAYVMCHNANCVGTDPFLDATIQALRQSLQLRWNGRPLLDGVELDATWDAAASRCAFAHDATRAAASFSGVEAATEVANHLRETAPVDRRFFVKLDMKAVTTTGPLSQDQAIAHADCVLDMYATIAEAALETGERVTIYFESEDTALVNLLRMRPRYPGKRRGEALQTGFIVPIRATVPPGLEVDVVSVEARTIKPEMHGQFRELRTRGIALMVWMFDADISVLDAIEEAEPMFVNTNEAALLREWLGEPPD